jgi:uncharacterized OB-fold protein
MKMCRNCGQSVDPDAWTCPNCGARTRGRSWVFYAAWAVVGLGVVLIVVAVGVLALCLAVMPR